MAVAGPSVASIDRPRRSSLGASSSEAWSPRQAADRLAQLEAAFAAGQGEQPFEQALLVDLRGRATPRRSPAASAQTGVRIGERDLQQGPFERQRGSELM